MALVAFATIEQALRQTLIEDPALSALVSTRVYPLAAPQNPTTPYGVYRVIDTPRVSSHSGPSSLASPRIQIDWIGSTETQALPGYATAVEVARAARLLLQDFSGLMHAIQVHRVVVEDERDLLDADLKLIGRSQDLIVWHEELS